MRWSPKNISIVKMSRRMTNFGFLEKITSWDCLLRSGWKLIFHRKAHSFILVRSLVFWGFNYWAMDKRKQSVIISKRSLTEDKPSAKSLIYIKDEDGPRIEPWETPNLTFVYEQDYSFNTTFCFFFRFKKKCTNFDKLPNIPFSDNLNIMLSCQALSNAFEKLL